MKTLKEHGLACKDVKAACVIFNGTGMAEKIKVVAVSGEAMLLDLLTKINLLTDDQMAALPADLDAFYSALPDEVFNQNVDPEVLKTGATPEEEGDEEVKPPAPVPAPAKGKGKKDAAAKEPKAPKAAKAPVTPPVEEVKGEADPDEALINPTHTSECPIYGKGWSAKEKECQTCNKEFHQDYVNCKRMVKGITLAKDAKKPKPRNSNGTTRQRNVAMMLSRYGHRINSMAGIIDDLIWEGTHFDTIVATLMAWHGRDEATAKAKLRSHIPWLIKTRGVNVTNTAGVLKSDIEYIPTQNAENTQDAIPAVEQAE